MHPFCTKWHDIKRKSKSEIFREFVPFVVFLDQINTLHVPTFVLDVTSLQASLHLILMDSNVFVCESL